MGECQKRASRVHNRTNYWNNIVKKCGWKVDIVFDNLTWEDACKIEVELIAKYGRIDLGTGTLVNLTDGGEGTLNRKMTEETKRKISKARTGNITHSDETKKKIGIKSKRILKASIIYLVTNLRTFLIVRSCHKMAANVRVLPMVALLKN